MDFSIFPDQWEWVALGLGGLAFLMAIQPFLQMIWGAPKITIGFGAEEMSDEIYLACEIRNEPIHNGFLNFMRISRNPSQEIVATFHIEEQGSGKVVFLTDTTVRIKTQADTAEERVCLRASSLPATFAIAVVNKKSGQVHVCDDRAKNLADMNILSHGVYITKVRLLIAGLKAQKARHILIVKDEHPFAYWAVNS